MTTWDIRWIGCGDLKTPTAMPALDLYLGPVFAAHRMIVEHTGGPVDHILSAEHVVLPADRVTAPYENRLPRNPRSAKSKVWSAKVVDFLMALPKLPKCLLVLAGAPYIDGWIKLVEAAHIEVDDPLRGMELGTRRNFAKRFVKETPKAPAEPRETLLGFLDHFRKAAASLQTGMWRWAECFFRTEEGVVECLAFGVDKRTPVAEILERAHQEGITELFEIQTDEGIWSREGDLTIFQTWEQLEAAEALENTMA